MHLEHSKHNCLYKVCVRLGARQAPKSQPDPEITAHLVTLCALWTHRHKHGCVVRRPYRHELARVPHRTLTPSLSLSFSLCRTPRFDYARWEHATEQPERRLRMTPRRCAPMHRYERARDCIAHRRVHCILCVCVCVCGPARRIFLHHSAAA